MSLLGQFNAMQNPAFYGRVWAACYKIADNVLNEDPTTPNHMLRVKLAQNMQAEPGTYADPFVKRCAMNASIGMTIDDDGVSTCPDGDIEYVVASVWESAALASLR